jgi:CBS domain containing-hemolysin-like protein
MIESDEDGPTLDQSTPEATDQQPQREGWLDRLRHRLGFRGTSIRADLADALAAGDTFGPNDFSPEERSMLRNILQLRGTQVEDVMVPRPDIIAVPSDLTLEELLRHFEAAGHSRLPVYEETLDDPRGMVHIKDVVGYITKHAQSGESEEAVPSLDLARVQLDARLSGLDLVRETLFVPGFMPALDLLAKMQTTRIHMALVIDEYGGTDGLVTIEDLVETVVGDIEDEHDEHEGPLLVAGPDGSFIADARVPLEDVVEAIGEAFDVGEAAEEVDTLGGLLVTLVGRVPVRGEIVPGPEGWEFEVLDADLRRVKRVKIDPLRNPASALAASRQRNGERGQAETETNENPVRTAKAS